MLAGLDSSEALSLSCRWPPSSCLFTGSVPLDMCPLASLCPNLLSHKDPSQTAPSKAEMHFGVKTSVSLSLTGLPSFLSLMASLLTAANQSKLEIVNLQCSLELSESLKHYPSVWVPTQQILMSLVWGCSLGRRNLATLRVIPCLAKV